MKTNHRRSTVLTLVSALLTVTFICQGVSSLAQTKSTLYGEKTAFIISKIDDAVTKEFQEAWRSSYNGSDGSEGLVLIYPTPSGWILAKSQGKSNEQKRFNFRWACNIIGVVHTHPDRVDPRPAGDDLRLADRFGVPVFISPRRACAVSYMR